MPWRLRFNEETAVEVDDLPGTALNKIAKKHGLNWLDLYAYPAQDLDAYRDLVALAAETAGAAMPPSESMRELRELVNLIERVTDDRPASFDEGGLPLVDESETG